MMLVLRRPVESAIVHEGDHDHRRRSSFVWQNTLMPCAKSRSPAKLPVLSSELLELGRHIRRPAGLATAFNLGLLDPLV